MDNSHGKHNYLWFEVPFPQHWVWRLLLRQEVEEIGSTRNIDQQGSTDDFIIVLGSNRGLFFHLLVRELRLCN